MNILLTFTGFHDPYSPGLVDQEEQEGPILALVRERPFDLVILFSTPNTVEHTAQTRNTLHKVYPEISVKMKYLSLSDPTNYIEILRGLRSHLRDILDSFTDANYYIAVASGTPQMHACWMLLSASGEIPARILHVRPRRFVTRERPLISEVDLTSPELPIVRANVCQVEAMPEEIPDPAIAIEQIGIAGDHQLLKQALEAASALAPSDVPVLILGETGVGKELFAKLVHSLSSHRDKAFIPINCAAIPKNLVESFLFGHKKGAFTGATRDQSGKFDAADGGTLFFDEVGELPLPTQAKLLRVIEDGVVEPVGSPESHKVTVRVVAATNRDMHKEILSGRFREDLFHRLNVGQIHLPPLRDRRSDIPNIALHILDKVNESSKRPKRFSPEALARLQKHSWPGNIRELVNVIERSVLLAKQQVLDADDLVIDEPAGDADPLASLPTPGKGFSLEDYLTSARKQLILRALDISQGNQSEAARLLGITPQAVSKFLRQTGDR